MIVLFCLAGYLYGSIPGGYLFVRWKSNKDIRSLGSHSTGATNVLRTSGWLLALPVMLLDVSKGVLPVLLGRLWFPGLPIVPLAGSLAAVLGHCFPVTLGFRGGKGVAAALGSFAALAWPASLLSLAVFAAAVALTRFVSLGSILAVVAFPFFRLLLGEAPGGYFWPWWVVLSSIILIRHKGNIRRLLQGRERRLGRTAGAEE